MTGTGPQGIPPSDPDGGSVRVFKKARTGRGRLLSAGLAIAAVVGITGWLLLPGLVQAPDAVAEEQAEASAAPPSGLPAAAPQRAPRAVAPRPVEDLPEEPYELPSLDPGDIAYYIRPGDPEPTAAELIEALHHAGIRTGIGAFNPPGTRPALEGLAVPEDYELPEGYVRHYQSTDEGEAIEPILMFSPDYDFFDSLGEPIALPENLVVPPELAPPGLPLRQVRIPND
ncbi:hypothetical protein [Alkalisalibacterium limincola]|uniref:hypothetical protein n=1 Tax=Alkalisalibacterium limincola TaxID=2699169 RepID=UPI001C9CCBC2|nr:hypothetical protein [Alkalisalibacterium limincola]